MMPIVSQIILFVIEILVTLGVVFGFQLIADYSTTKYSNEVVWIGNMNWQLKLSAIIYFSVVGISLSVIEHLYFFNTLALVNLRIMAILLLLIFLGTQIATIVVAVALTAYFLLWGFQSYIVVYSLLYVILFTLIVLINQSKRLTFNWQLLWFGVTTTLFWAAIFVYKNIVVASSLSVTKLLLHLIGMVFLCGIPVLLIRFLEQNQLLISEQTLGAYIDELTQLYNYHSFSLNFERAFQKTGNTKKVLNLMIMDLDGFKHVNDTYGHLAGNAVLKEFSGMLSAMAGTNIVPYRIGGEEMALIFNDVTSEYAQQLAEQLLKQLRQHQFIYENRQIKLTFSAGLSQVKQTDETSRAFFRRVDDLTYTAKRAGGNQIAV
ncbi:GGDEF domain-containing protein [Loigolactobacillus zhaoyuanensis]|uniref:GGDEF domain-containing protein n=1 Tax=Loigolactobacillus zhaoyuanensis TaxID=2486017 RepID=A0ABW8UCK3_9LACO|nr:GGDEF domain-containing protein [Loigolactobacillus zhaoyuanensis]